MSNPPARRYMYAYRFAGYKKCAKDFELWWLLMHVAYISTQFSKTVSNRFNIYDQTVRIADSDCFCDCLADVCYYLYEKERDVPGINEVALVW